MSIRISRIVASAALVVLWFLLGVWTPKAVSLWRDYPLGVDAYDWPHDILPYVHWIWTAPVGVSLGCATITSSRMSRKSQRITHVAVWFLTIAAWFFCVCGAIPHRMVYPVK